MIDITFVFASDPTFGGGKFFNKISLDYSSRGFLVSNIDGCNIQKHSFVNLLIQLLSLFTPFTRQQLMFMLSSKRVYSKYIYVDGFPTLFSVSPFDWHKTKIVATNIEWRYLWLNSKYSPGLRKILFFIDSLKMYVWESIFFRLMSKKIYFASEIDAVTAREMGARVSKKLHSVTFESIDTSIMSYKQRDKFGPYVLFIGPGSYPPNREALTKFIEYANNYKAQSRNSYKILVTGNGWNLNSLPNTEFLGFIEPSEFNSLVLGAIAVIAPYMESTGVKVKLIEALSLGATCLATDVCGVSKSGRGNLILCRPSLSDFLRSLDNLIDAK